jgi:hypothetical protein
VKIIGYSTRNNGQIRDYWPDNTDTELFVESATAPSLEDLIALAKEKWPNSSLDNVVVSGQEIHTRCLTYDMYDSSDYDDFIVLTLVY